MKTDTDQPPMCWAGELRSAASGTQWYHRSALIFVVACVVASALAASWPQMGGGLPFEPLIALLLPCLRVLVFTMIGLVLRCLGTGPGHRELSFLGNAYLWAALGYAATLSLWPASFAAVGQWLGPLSKILFALGIALYCLKDEHPGISLRYLKIGILAVTALVLGFAFLSQLSWPLQLLEVVAITCALMLLLGNPQKWPAIEAWVTAGVALLLIEGVLLQVSSDSGALVWLAGYLAQLLAAIILLYVVLTMAQRPRRF